MNSSAVLNIFQFRGALGGLWDPAWSCVHGSDYDSARVQGTVSRREMSCGDQGQSSKGPLRWHHAGYAEFSLQPGMTARGQCSTREATERLSRSFNGGWSWKAPLCSTAQGSRLSEGKLVFSTRHGLQKKTQGASPSSVVGSLPKPTSL